jgi:hypothetical protein
MDDGGGYRWLYVDMRKMKREVKEISRYIGMMIKVK